MNKAVLLVNLGSPDSTSVGDVRRYLNEFLMDGRVIDTPWLLRRFIVGMILINRPRQAAEAYRKIWTAGRFAAHRHKPQGPGEVAGAGHRAGRTGHAVSASIHRKRHPQARGAEG